MNSILNSYLILIFTIYCFLSLNAFYEDSEDFSFNLNEGKIKLTPIPVVIWHGMGDSCCNPLSMYYIKKLIQTNIPGIYVKSIMLGNNVIEDVEKGFFSNMNEQINIVCEMLKKDENLLNGYNAIGFSQGGLFILPHCSGSLAICDTIRHLLDYGAYEMFIQRTDPNKKEEYQRKNIFLTDLNCETWFGFYAENDTNTIIPMEQTRLYKEDLIGLKTLKKSGRLHFLSINGEHLHFPPGVFTKEIINKYLKNESKLNLNDQMEEEILDFY
uniref:Palmitoyl-protein thioesterase 1 n=1 Tax=Meloidogyne hapla TaxID=6305 RepID=A0A1I8B8A3_MELHA